MLLRAAGETRRPHVASGRPTQREEKRAPAASGESLRWVLKGQLGGMVRRDGGRGRMN